MALYRVERKPISKGSYRIGYFQSDQNTAIENKSVAARGQGQGKGVTLKE